MQNQSLRSRHFLGSIAALLALSTSSLQAHPFHTNLSGLTGGLAHPLLGLDHILAMVAVGLWAAQLGGRARWLVPGSFLTMMIAGGALGFGGVAVPFVEQGIVASLIIIGLFIAIAARLPLWTGMALVGFFALFHGHAHATELAAGFSALAYTIGFVLATAGLHLVGIGLGVAAQRRGNLLALRFAGVSVAVIGLVLCWT